MRARVNPAFLAPSYRVEQLLPAQTLHAWLLQLLVHIVKPPPPSLERVMGVMCQEMHPMTLQSWVRTLQYLATVVRYPR